MKPMIIIPPDTMSPEDVKMLNYNGICTVVSSDPGKLRFLDPIPAADNRDKMERAAVKLTRILLNGQWNRYYNTTQESLNRFDFCYLWTKCLVEGSSLDPDGTRDEREQVIIDSARRGELERIGREEARAEYAAKKAAKAKAKTEAK